MLSKGSPRIGTKHFGILSVRGRSLVPNPAAKRIARITFKLHYFAKI